jgi:hypothetical protein
MALILVYKFLVQICTKVIYGVIDKLLIDEIVVKIWEVGKHGRM